MGAAEALKRAQAAVYTAICALLGRCMWATLLCLSVPWLFGVLLWMRQNRSQAMRDANPNVPEEVHEEHEERLGYIPTRRDPVEWASQIQSIGMMAIHLFSFMNIAVLGCVLYFKQLLFVTVGWPELGFTYAITFASASIARSSLRMLYGSGSREADSIDRELLSLFGVYLVQRGDTSEWIYPLLSLFPACVVKVISDWFTRTHFRMLCRPSMEECVIDKNVWDPATAIPFLGTQLIAIYGATKALAHFLVKLDPHAVGTLSELRCWQEKQKRGEAHSPIPGGAEMEEASGLPSSRR